MWAEAERLARDLNVDYEEMFANTLRSTLYTLKDAKQKALSISEKERKHRESYEKNPVGPEEFYIDEDQIEEVWKDL